jgi:uncharacterized membrane protein
MLKFLTDLRNSFWFVPSVIVLGCAGCAMAAIELDGIVGDDALAHFPRLFGAGAEGARELLSAIAGSTITVAGVVFSITIVALSLTAAQYSPRVLRNFMGDRGNQVVLGVFVGIYVYCLLVLRTVRGGEEGFVPGISIVGALALAIVGVGFLIFFIHHIALSIQVSQIAAHVSRDAIAAVHDVYPPYGLNDADPQAMHLDLQHWHLLAAPASGYIQQLDVKGLLDWASTNRRIVRVDKAVGEFVVRGHPMLQVSGEEAPEPKSCEQLIRAFVINTYRDIAQDPEFGIQQLVDIALKALSPGVNDIGTARNVLHYITSVLCELAGRSPEQQRHYYADGKLALVKRSRSFEEMVQSALAPIRREARDKPDIMLQLTFALDEVGRAARTREHRDVVVKHVRAIQDPANLERFSSAEADAIARVADTVLYRCEAVRPHAREARQIV